MLRDRAPPGRESDTDALILPTWRWHARDPWYGGGRQGSLRRKRAAARNGALSFGGPLDLAIVALLLLLLLGLQTGSFGGHRGGACEVHPSDLGWLRRSIIICESAIVDLKKQARGQLWSKWSQCGASTASLSSFFNFTPKSFCPDTPRLAENLRFRDNCHELPRRNCISKQPQNGVDPRNYLDARWHLPSDRNVMWEDYECEGYTCVMERGDRRCRGCFNLTGEQKMSELHTSFSVDDVLALKAPGRVRIGVDVGGGSGDFSASLADRGVLIVTVSDNAGLPFMETIASRGLLGLHLPLNSRLPFFDATLDLVRFTAVPHTKDVPKLDEFELLLFEWDRVLRPGGLLWLDRVRRSGKAATELKDLLKMFGYQKRMWNTSAIRPSGRNVVLSTVLEKPLYRKKKEVKPLATMT